MDYVMRRGLRHKISGKERLRNFIVKIGEKIMDAKLALEAHELHSHL